MWRLYMVIYEWRLIGYLTNTLMLMIYYKSQVFIKLNQCTIALNILFEKYKLKLLQNNDNFNDWGIV